MSSPAKSMRPPRRSTRLMIAFSNVVLPAPLAPSSTTDLALVDREIDAPQAPACADSRRQGRRPRAAVAARQAAFSSPRKTSTTCGLLDSVRQPAFEDLLAGVHDDDAVGDLIDESHQMLDDEQRDAGARQLLELVGHALEFRRVESGGKLVDQQQPRAGRQRAREIEHLLLRAVELGRPVDRRRRRDRARTSSASASPSGSRLRP